MSNPAKRRGTAHESAVVEYLKSRGIPAYRPAQTGRFDVGDVHGCDPVILQCKSWQDVTSAIREGVDGAQLQAMNAGAPLGVAVIKRPRRPVADAYVAMRLSDFARVLRVLRGDDDAL